MWHIRENIKSHITSQEQISESLLLNIFLSISGGFQDAYTYVCRGGVFANAQTGNVVLFSMNIAEGNISAAVRFLVPVIAFAVGILAASFIQQRFRYAKKLHWRQLVLLIEIFILAVVSFIPLTMNFIANMLVSFACALQVQTFRTVSGHPYASTMCIGNIRSGMTFLADYIRSRDKRDLRHAMYYFAIILFFAVGAGVGAELSKVFGMRVILIPCVLLVAGFTLMEIDRE